MPSLLPLHNWVLHSAGFLLYQVFTHGSEAEMRRTSATERRGQGRTFASEQNS